jgi:predicted dehydrogenase
MLDFAVIGVGRMGKRHAFNIAHGLLRGVRLAAYCDVDENALKRCARLAPRAKAFTDYRQMLKEVKLDGVVIATPHYSHAEIAVYCIKNGVNTLVEKPLAVTAAQAEEVESAAVGNANVKVGVSFNQRSNKNYIRLKKIIESGELGGVQRVDFTITDWYRSQAYYDQGGWRASFGKEGGGCLINQCVHQLDVLLWLLGLPESVFAENRTVNRKISVENDVAAVLDYKTFDCIFRASTHELKGVNRLEVVFDGGRAMAGKYFMKLYRHKSEKKVNAETKFGYGFAPSRLSLHTYGFFRMLADLIKGQQLRALRAFAAEVRGKGDMLAGVGDGVRAAQLINGLYTAGWTGQRTALPADEKTYQAILEQKIREENDER